MSLGRFVDHQVPAANNEIDQIAKSLTKLNQNVHNISRVSKDSMSE